MANIDDLKAWAVRAKWFLALESVNASRTKLVYLTPAGVTVIRFYTDGHLTAGSF